MSRYRITINRVPGHRGDGKKFVDVDADTEADAALMMLDHYDYEAYLSDVVLLWEGDEPEDQRLRRLGMPTLPGLEV